MTFFAEMSLLLLVTALTAFIMHRIKQPLVIAYILAGIIAGPQFFNWLKSSHELEIFAEAGIVFLLFIVGIHLNPTVIKEVGKIALITGLGQILFTSAIGMAIALALGFATGQALYIAIALTFSSTIIIMKLISDKRDLDKLYAKISIGFLLVQDLAAAVILVLVPILSSAQSDQVMSSLGQLSLQAVALSVGVYAMARWVLPRFFQLAAKSSELLFFSAVTWGIGVASLFSYVNLSLEVGALVAGIALSTSAFAEEISSRMKPLRDFFLVVFFLLLGSQLILDDLQAIILPAIVLSAFVLIGNPIIVYIIMQLFGYSRKVSFQSGFTVAQISEFSLIVIAMGVALGQVSSQTASLVTLVGIITIALSTYAILYSDWLFEKLDPLLKKLPSRSESAELKLRKRKKFNVLWFGFNPIRDELISFFPDKKTHISVVDYNPEHIAKVEQLGLTPVYGDASDVEFLSALPWHEVHAVVSMIPDSAVNSLILQQIQSAGGTKYTFFTAQNVNVANQLYELGAHHVAMPFHLSAKKVVGLVRNLW
jgi:Kef-type K+ transport system membrane component KefB